MSDRVIGPLRELRAPIHEGLRQVQTAGVAVQTAEGRVALAALQVALEFVEGRLLPHLNAEEFTLLPAADGVLGHPAATGPLRAQHVSIRAMAGDLRKAADAAFSAGEVAEFAQYLLPLLYGLYALARAHVESEDDVLLAILDEHLSESQAGVIVKNIERITAAGA
jgi:hypothetical protein